MNLHETVAVVTGGTKGVGRGVARELAQQGASVFVTGRSAPDRHPIDERITGIRCDHRDDGEVKAAFDHVIAKLGETAEDHAVARASGGARSMTTAIVTGQAASRNGSSPSVALWLKL